MDRSRVWAFIDDTRTVSDDCPARHAKSLSARLERLDPDEIVEFAEHWRELDVAAYRWELWAAAYLLNGGCDDVCFEHFRSYVIGLGEEVYTRALDDPDSLVFLACGPARQFAHDAAALGAAAEEAYERATGCELPEVGPELPEEPAGEEWDEERPELVTPRIAAAVGWLEA
jgi:hypothetical protein